ncbi:MAG: phytanoyl-CoA dioxygenase family protein [Planctomycetota bacterium]
MCFAECGHAVVPSGCSEATLTALAADFDRLVEGSSTPYAVRGVLQQSPCVRAVAGDLLAVASSLLGAECVVSKATYFDKTHENNWLVPWHQDLTITVQQQHSVPGFEHWRQKHDASMWQRGIWHVQPPESILSRIVALRLHIDRCSGDNGALRVLPGTHRFGVLSADAIAQHEADGEAETLAAERGEIVAMAPLLLHASSKSQQPARRRVLHLEFCAAELPAPLAWHG